MALRKFDVDQLSADQFAAKMKDPDFKAEFEALYPVEIPAPTETVDPEGFASPAATVVAPSPVQIDPEGFELPPAPVAAPVAPVDVEQRYEYQPVDKHGRKVGGLQCIKYKTQDELIKKLTDNHIEAIRWGREEHAARVVGKPVEDDEIPVDAERGEVEFVELKAKPLTAEERFAIIQDMQDPAKFEEGRARLFESEFGVPTSKVRDLLNTAQLTSKQAVVEASFAEFQRETPDFYPDVDNITKMTGWMAKHELLPTVKNFKLAYAAMVRQDCLNIAPVVQQVAAAVPAKPEPKTVAPVVPETRISPAVEPVQTPRSQAPSGLNDRTSSSTGNRPASDDKSLTLADIDKMSADEYKRRLKDPAFGKYVEQLEAAVAQKRAQRAASRI